MATQSSSTSAGVGSSNAPTIVQVLVTKRNPEIWCNYDKVLLSDGSTKAFCKRCGKFLKADSNSTLKSHATKYCDGVKSNPESSQATMSRDGGIFTYEAERCREAFAGFVIQEALPFNHFDNPRLTRVIQNTLQPRYNHVSRLTLRRDALKLWKNAKSQLIIGFENLNTNVSLTTDVWSAPHGLPGSYLCVTAHWVDPATWQMMKRTIAFENFDYPHTGKNLFYMLRDVMKMFKIEQKVFSISFDNATNNTNAVQRLILKYEPPLKGIFYHSRCVAHIINLVVQDGLAVQEISVVKNAYKIMLQDIFCSGKARYKHYMRLCKETDSIFLTPNWDMPVRWNSTYNMFMCGLRQRDTLYVFHDQLVQKGLATSFSSDYWEVIQKITELLKVFKTATTLLSGVYYPTSHLVLNQIFLMSSKLSEYEFCGNVYAIMVAPMKAKLRKYFKEMPPVISCAAALNPCLNIFGVELLIDNICNDLDLNDEDPFFSQNTKDYFNKSFKDLFGHYFQKYSSTTMVSSSSASTMFASSSSSRDPMINLYNSLRQENHKRARGDGDQRATSEFGRYTGTDFLASMGPEEFAHFDILAWWKGRESQFPILTIMARDLLTVQASTVASESAFSLSGRVLSIRRTRLTPASLEMCICLKDHLDAAERIQNVSSLEGELEYEGDIHDIEVEAGMAISLSDEEIALDQASREASSEEDFDF
jgi:hypothetical protein